MMANDVYIRGTGAAAPPPAPAETNPEEPTENTAPTDSVPEETTPAPDVSLGPGFNPDITQGQ